MKHFKAICCGLNILEILFIHDIISDLMGLNNISPNFKKDDKSNDDLKENPPKNDNGSAAMKSDDKKSSAKLHDDIKKLKKIKKAKKPSKKPKKKGIKDKHTDLG